MSAQFHQTVQQWQELEAEGRYELEARRIEDANTVLQEMSAAQDDEFRASLEQKYPQLLAAWPGRNK